MEVCIRSPEIYPGGEKYRAENEVDDDDKEHYEDYKGLPGIIRKPVCTCLSDLASPFPINLVKTDFTCLPSIMSRLGGGYL